MTKEIYHQKSAEDLHFYMIKVTDDNTQRWVDWKDDNDYGNARGGTQAFSELFWIKNKSPEIKLFVCYASSSILSEPTLPNSGNVEMVVGMITSTNSPFTAHMGIFRANDYKHEKHKDLSMKLHSFAAKAALEAYPTKLYMVTDPYENMRGIILKSIYEKNIFSWIGTEYEQVTNIDTLQHSLNEAKQRLENNLKNPYFLKLDRSGKDIEELLKLKNNLSIKNEEAFCPFKEGSNREFIIYDQGGEVIYTINRDQVSQEFFWLFRHPDLHPTTNGITTLLADLASSEDTGGEIEHFSCAEMPIEELAAQKAEVNPIGSSSDQIGDFG